MVNFSGMSDHDKVMAKIRALLAIANDARGATENEREVAREKAERMMIRYAIDSAGLNLTEEQKTQVGKMEVPFTGQNAHRRSVLLRKVAKAFKVRAIGDGQHSRESWGHVTLVGFQADIEMTLTLFDHLDQQMVIAMIDSGERGGDAMSRFCAGYAEIVGDRLEEFYAKETREAINEGTTTALVLADRSRSVEAAVNRLFPYLTSSRVIRGSASGRAAGAKADITLSGRKVTSNTRLLAAA